MKISIYRTTFFSTPTFSWLCRVQSLVSLSAILFSNIAFAGQDASGLWTDSAPLPATAFSSSNCNIVPANMNFDIGGDPDMRGERFILSSTLAVNTLLKGLCFNAMGVDVAAAGNFSAAKGEFQRAINWLAQESDREADRLNSRKKMVGELGQLAGVLLGSKSGSATQQINREIYRQIIKIATDAEIQDIQKSLNDPALSTPPGFTGTIRIPVIPVAGFLKHLVQVKLPTGGHCTGSFVGPKIVLTNLHCVKPGIRVVRDHVVVREEYSVKTWWTYRGERGTLTPQEAASGTTGGFGDDDWALIEINEDRPDANDYLTVPAKTPNTPKVMIAGYSADVSRGRHATLDLNCPVIKVAGNFAYECSTSGGSSGSPIISMFDQRLIVALNNASFRRTDSANTRGGTFGVRVERFAPKLYEMLGTRPPEWTESGADARDLLKDAKARFENRGKVPDLPKWE